MTQAFNGGDRAVLHLDRQLHAGVNRLPIRQDRARAAGRPIADLLGAGKLKLVPQDIEKGDPRFNFQFVPVPVDLQDHFCGPRSDRFLVIQRLD